MVCGFPFACATFIKGYCCGIVTYSAVCNPNVIGEARNGGNRALNVGALGYVIIVCNMIYGIISTVLRIGITWSS